MSARRLAVTLLEQTERNEGYSNLLLDHALEESGLDARDKRLCAALYYGVLERKLTLDHIISKYSKKPPRKLDGIVLQILRTGLYQLLYMQQIPDTAAVSESVKLTKKCRKASASGFVNAVLRSFLRDEKKIALPEEPDARVSVQYSAPLWLVQMLFKDYGEEEAISFLSDALDAAPLTIRRNPLVMTEEKLLAAFAEEGIEKHPLIPDAYTLKGGNIRKNSAFEQGAFHVQDAASQLCAAALDAKPGMTVLDLCAAPGGKTFTIAEYMEGTGMVYAFDLQPQRAGLIEKGAERLRLKNVQAQAGDASVWNEMLPKADRVLCDVPCSGIGVIRRKPEIRYKDRTQFADLPGIQYAILENASGYVKEDGILLYSTCTILKEENEQVVERFLNAHPEFEPEPLLPQLHEKLAAPMMTLLPSFAGSDGFFMAKLRRKK
ncbi:MAG: 16S rRNA (cytosine(967)-C(5))-methyltransferase RsmB [Ruminococcus sp.]|nr:16S rRNA (cytosine(967)-C(5))-methyltransferase RsmB [Ruminococcus sp.]